MEKEKMEEKVDYTKSDFEIDDTQIQDIPLQEIPKKEETKVRSNKLNKRPAVMPDEIVNCLRNERVIIRHIPKESGMVTNPKHILYGGMAENAVRTFVVPKLTTGTYVNVLTNSEMAFLFLF